MKPFVGKSQMHLFRKTCVALCLGAFAIMAPAQTDTAIKVGLLSTLSGPGAGLGVDIRDGFQLAVKLSGGKFAGKDVEVIVADDQASPDVGRQTADRLVKRDKVDFMTGIVFSNVMLAVGTPTFQSKTFYISANAGPSQLAGEQCNPYFFSAS
jgi:branched-chain amino acid transport system substrate-binding protein